MSTSFVPGAKLVCLLLPTLPDSRLRDMVVTEQALHAAATLVPISLTRLCTMALRYSLIMAGAKVGGEQLSAVSYSTAALSGRTAVAVGPQRLRFGGLTQPKHGIYLQHWL